MFKHLKMVINESIDIKKRQVIIIEISRKFSLAMCRMSHVKELLFHLLKFYIQFNLNANFVHIVYEKQRLE